MFEVLDTFCKAGGCSVGYHWALEDLGVEHEITGVDIEPQPRYPFKFIQADALTYIREHGSEYDFIHASPPCQGYSTMKAMTTKEYPKLVPEVRVALEQTGKPYVIENVPGAPLRNPLMLCGTMFGLLTIRHRLFETRPEIYFPPASCNHYRKTQKQGRVPDPDRHFITVTGCYGGAEFARRAMGIDWMRRHEMAEAVPPSYTRYVLRQMFGLLGK